MPTYLRTDQAAIFVTVTGITIDSLSWSSMEGGDNTAESVPIRPGGASPQVELASLPKRTPLTIKRPWSDVLFNAYKALDNAAGKAAVTAVYQLLDGNMNAIPGATITYTGTLLSTMRPNYDSESSTKAELQITVGTNGAIS